MKVRPLGNTGLEISELVFGAGAVGGVVFKPERSTRIEAVRRALAGGVNWIDTAPSYGNGKSEENLGWILEELAASPYLSTKVRIDPEHSGDIEGEVRRSLEASLKRLRRDRIELIQLHSRIVSSEPGRGAVTVDQAMGSRGVADAFDRLKAEGVIRFSGITGLGDPDALLRVVESGRFQTVQAYHNLLNPSAGTSVPSGFGALDYRNLIGVAHRRGMGVMNIRVLAAGTIAGKEAPAGMGPISPGSEPEKDRARAAAVARALEGESGTMAQKAIRFALTNTGVSGVLVGFSEPGHVDEALAAVESGPLSDSSMERLRALWLTGFVTATGK